MASGQCSVPNIYKLKTKKMKELDITELKMINGGVTTAESPVAEQIGYIIGRTIGLSMSLLGSRWLLGG